MFSCGVCVQELVFASNTTQKEAVKREMHTRIALLKKEYAAMLYGHDGVRNETSSHFT